MTFYSIKQLGEISGIKPHTIRIWEKRYNVLKPSRSDTNIRSYDDNQLKKLLNISELINRGMKISKISKLTEAQISLEIDRIIEESFNGGVTHEALITQAIIAISALDEKAFDTIFKECISTLGVENTYLSIIYPLLVKTGLMWSNSEIMPAQEHFLSGLIKQKLFAVINDLPLPDRADQTWVLFLGENEEHEIGLLFANYVLRNRNKRVVYLGSKVPYENLVKVAEQCKATHLYTFFVRNQPAEWMLNYIMRLKADFKNLSVCYTGNLGEISKESCIKDTIWIKSVENLIEMTKK